MVTARFLTRLMVLLMSMFLLSACGGDDSTTSTPLTSEGTADGPFVLDATLINTDSPHSGTVGNESVGKSYYTATVASGTTYIITLYGLSARVDPDASLSGGDSVSFTLDPAHCLLVAA